MVLRSVLGVSEGIAMLVAAVLLLLVGGQHVFMPAESLVGMLLSMIDGVAVTNGLSNVPGLLTRVVGVFVVLLGWDMLRDLY